MKKVLSIVAVSALVMSAGVAFAGGPGKQGAAAGPGCPDECQQQIDELQGSQAQQNEMLAAQAKEIEALKNQEDSYNPWYVRGAFKMGWGSQKDNFSRDLDTEMGLGFQAAFGKVFKGDSGDFRLEAENSYQYADLDDNSDGDVAIQAYMINGYYDLPLTEMFGLYVTAGAGLGKYDLNAGLMETPNSHINYVNHSESVFAYKGGAGMSFNFTEQLAVDLGYEYLGTSHAVINAGEINDIRSHNIVTSVRFMF